MCSTMYNLYNIHYDIEHSWKVHIEILPNRIATANNPQQVLLCPNSDDIYRYC